MLKKEFKCNIKSLIIWIGIIAFLLLVVFAIYPSMMQENANMTEMMKEMFSPEVLRLFNMDIVGFDSVFGWIATEGYLLLVLLGGSYFAILGGTILLKEQDDHTIDFLYSKPISKNKIVTSKILLGLLYILIFCGGIALINFIGLTLSNDFDFIKWLLISVLPIFVCLFFFMISLLISLGFKKTSTSIGANLGAVFGFYILSMLGALSDKIEFLKYLSPFYYTDARSVLENSTIDILNIGIVTICSIVFGVLLYISYNKKELGK